MHVRIEWIVYLMTVLNSLPGKLDNYIHVMLAVLSINHVAVMIMTMYKGGWHGQPATLALPVLNEETCLGSVIMLIESGHSWLILAAPFMST